MTPQYTATQSLAIDDLNGELLVNYSWDKENGHIYYSQINYIQIVICGEATDFNPSERVIAHILDRLEYMTDKEKEMNEDLFMDRNNKLIL